jgi:hypothetical protein
VDHHTGTFNSGQRFLNALAASEPSIMVQTSLGQRSRRMLNSIAVPGFRVLLLSRAEARQGGSAAPPRDGVPLAMTLVRAPRARKTESDGCPDRS